MCVAGTHIYKLRTNLMNGVFILHELAGETRHGSPLHQPRGKPEALKHTPLNNLVSAGAQDTSI